MDSKELDKIKDQLLQFVNGAKGATPLVRFIPLVCALDAASNYWCGRSNKACNGVVFKSFITFYLPGYSLYSGVLYDQLRCQLVHSFTLGNRIALSSDHPECHCKFYDRKAKQCIEPSGKPTSNTPLIVNVDNFADEVTAAIKMLFEDVDVLAPRIMTKIVGKPDTDKVSVNKYFYSFKGGLSETSFGEVSDYDRLSDLDNQSKGLIDLDDKNWVFDHRDAYSDLHKKLNFINDIRNEIENRPNRTVRDNILKASKEIRLLQVEAIQMMKSSLDANLNLASDGQLTSTYSITGTH